MGWKRGFREIKLSERKGVERDGGGWGGSKGPRRYV